VFAGQSNLMRSSAPRAEEIKSHLLKAFLGL